MALGILKIIYTVLIIIAVIIQILLYKGKNETRNSIFIINMLFAILLSYLAYTSLATNFTGQIILSISLGVISVLAVVLKIKVKKSIMLSKAMLSVSIIGSVLQLYL